METRWKSRIFEKALARFRNLQEIKKANQERWNLSLKFIRKSIEFDVSAAAWNEAGGLLVGAVEEVEESPGIPLRNDQRFLDDGVPDSDGILDSSLLAGGSIEGIFILIKSFLPPTMNICVFRSGFAAVSDLQMMATPCLPALRQLHTFLKQHEIRQWQEQSLARLEDDRDIPQQNSISSNPIVPFET